MNETALARDVARLADRLAIIERVTTAVTFGDLHEFEAQAACYADIVEVDYSQTLGDAASHVPRGDLMAYWKRIVLAFDGMSHAVTNVAIQNLDETRASTRSYVRAVHWIGGRVWTSCGIYTHGLTRSADGRWVIDRQHHGERRQEGDRWVFEEAMRRAGIQAPSR